MFESFIGALYLDQGLEAVTAFLHRHVFSQLTFDGKLQTSDYKTELQELTQHHNMGTLEYRIIEERGPAHEREFVSEVWMEGRALGREPAGPKRKPSSRPRL
ncbi:hypothetical protein HMSSN036_71400 [Paenibacillus macerans]|nr:hypothetical protein HMSSN036_71400 [Paenibacillus macerans]